MPTQQMVPPNDGSRNSVTFNGRIYKSTPGVAIPVQSFDVPILEANRWSVQTTPTLSGTSGETIYGKLRRLAKTARFNNPRVLPVMTVPPTVAVSTTIPATLTNITQYQANPAPFSFTGGNVVPWSGGATYTQAWCVTRYSTGNGNIANNPPRDGVGWRCEFMADAAIVGISVLNLASTPFRFIVDGQYVSLTASTPPGGSATAYFTLDFTGAPGGRKARRIVVEGELSGAFLDARVGPTESISALSPADRLRMVIGGDSITAGIGATRPTDGWAFVMGDALGIKDMWASGSGGTGYLASNGGTKYTLRQRISDLSSPSPDIVGIAMGINDAPSAVAAIQAEVLLVISMIRATLPKTPIAIFGVFLGNVSLAVVQALETGIATTLASAQVSDPNLIFVPVTTAPDGAWIFGTGRVGAPTANGNADIYTSADGVHPSTAGHAYLGYRAADGLIAAIADTSRYP